MDLVSKTLPDVNLHLLGNICKYSMPGTRVYIELAQNKNTASMIFKNISDTVLNVSPDELVERFVRGDSSRSTEGSGLGLSIVKKVMEQNGGSCGVASRVGEGSVFWIELPVYQ